MLTDRSRRRKLIPPIRHTGGQTVKNDVSMLALSDDREGKTASVRNPSPILSADLASILSVKLLDNTLFKSHKRQSSIGYHRL